jgi:Xaa-Pro aminopeptidase
MMDLDATSVTAQGRTATGADALSGALRACGALLTADQVRALLLGVAAAPLVADPDAWMTLIKSRRPLGKALQTVLRDLLAEFRAAPDGLAADAPRTPRLVALRNELRRRHLDGFIIPRADEHQGEYVPTRAQRLTWLTGFTGSAGAAVVLAKKAAVFTDSRYTLQIRTEVDGKAFVYCDLHDEPIAAWIAANLPTGARLGYDPWLHTTTGLERLHAACKQAGGKIVAAEDNPIDAIWQNQPTAPLAPVLPHGPRFAGKAHAKKCREIARAITDDGVDAVILTAPDSIAWLLNLRGGDVPYTPLALSFAILYADASVDLFIDSRKLTTAAGRHLGRNVHLAEPGALAAAIDALGRTGKSVRVDPAGAPVWVMDRLRRATVRVVPGVDPCALPKALKNKTEAAGVRAAHLRDGVALTGFLAWLSEAAGSGRLTEMAAADKLDSMRRGNRYFQGYSFPTISGAGPNGAVVHYRVSELTNRVLKAGSLFLVDSGAQYLDGTTDVTRTIAIGKPTNEMKDRFTRVLKGHIAIATTIFPSGTTGSHLDILARRPLWSVGLDYGHGTGHGVGSYLGVHEGPHRISRAFSNVPLQPGMIVSNEPGYYKTGRYGIRIENLVLVVPAKAPKGAEQEMFALDTLTLAPIDRNLIDAKLLSADEIRWLDDYHARVQKALSPALGAQAQAWLKRVTRPLLGR